MTRNNSLVKLLPDSAVPVNVSSLFFELTVGRHGTLGCTRESVEEIVCLHFTCLVGYFILFKVHLISFREGGRGGIIYFIKYSRYKKKMKLRL